MKKRAYIVLLASALSAEDVMVERMQSVVDEVAELRSRYESSARNNEACEKQVREQAKIIEEASQSEGLDYKRFEENKKRLAALQEENGALKKRLAAKEQNTANAKEIKGLQEEVELLLKENARLNTSAKILQEKNRSLLDQINTFKGNTADQEKGSELQNELLSVQEALKGSQALNRRLEQQIKESKTPTLQEKVADVPMDEAKYRLLSSENAGLKKELQALKTESASLKKECSAKTITRIKEVTKRAKPNTLCQDENPFPKLMMKTDREPVPAKPVQRTINREEASNTPESSRSDDAEEVIMEKGRTYRMKEEGAIYDAPGGKVIAVWEGQTSFTSNIYKGEWIKITGYFVNMRWKKAAEAMWVRSQDTLKR